MNVRIDTPYIVGRAGKRATWWSDLQRIAFVILLLSVLTPPAHAQRLSILKIDPSLYPDISASVLLLGSDQTSSVPFTAGDLVVDEEGIERTVTSVSCPPLAEPEPLSVVIVLDQSGSMTAPMPSGQITQDLVVNGVRAFFRSLHFAPPTSVALTAFNDNALILSDFRTSAEPLLMALASLTPAGGTFFDPPFLDPVSGAIEMLKRRPDSVRRIVVFISDGEPNVAPSTGLIIARANAANVDIFPVTIGVNITGDLQAMADQTGGTAWGGIDTEGELNGVLQSIALITRGVVPCRVTWRTENGCGPGPVVRNVEISHRPSSASGTGTYRMPENGLVTLEVSPKFLWFGEAQFPAMVELPVTIVARNGSVRVNGVDFSNDTNYFVSSWNGPAPPFTLSDGESRVINVTFRPTDSTGYAGTMEIDADPCASKPILLAGGKRGFDDPSAPLHLVTPRSGDSYDACDSIDITWGGVPPNEPVRIGYSSDGGRTWKTISDRATGYLHRWLPPGPGTAYRFRVSTDADEQHIIHTIAGGGTEAGDEIFATDAALLSPMGADAADDTLFFVELGRHKLRAVDLRSGSITTIVGTGTQGNGGDGGIGPTARLNSPHDVDVDGDTIFIADTDNHKIRLFDRNVRKVYTFAGNLRRGFSPDGTRMDTGMLMAPVSVVSHGGYLYVSERDSNRVRRIDLATKIITTVAGGGGNLGFDSDGRPATEAQLITPAGIAIHDSTLFIAERVAGRIRAVNLRTGIINTIAGNGTTGPSGDGGRAIDAQLASPLDVAVWGDSLFIADQLNEKIRLVDRKSGIITTFSGNNFPGFRGDRGPARSAQFNSPSSVVVYGDLLYVSDRLNNRIREITLYLPDGFDITNGDIRITAPQAALGLSLVDMGDMAVDGVRDSMLTGLICNVGDVAMRIDSARVVGTHAGDFRIVGGLSEVPLPPDSCRTVTVEFMPGGLGARSAQVIVYGSCAHPDTLELRGRGINGCALSTTELVDLGTHPFDEPGSASADSTVVRALCNNGTFPISGSVSILSPDGAFAITSGAGPFTLAPGECLDLTIAYATTFSGRSMAVIDFGLPTACEAERLTLLGEAVQRPILIADAVALPVAPCPDVPVDTSIVVRNDGGQLLQITDIAIVSNDEGFTLIDPAPTTSTPLTILPGETGRVPVRMMPTSAGPKSALIRFISNDPDSLHTVELTGRRDSMHLELIESTVAIVRHPGRAYPGDTNITIVNRGDVAMVITGLDIDQSDAGFYQVVGDPFPIVIRPGDSATIPVRFGTPSEDRPYSARLTPRVAPDCLGPISSDIVLGGSSPLLIAEPLRLPSIFCDPSIAIDTTIVVRNAGGSTLTISGITTADDPTASLQIMSGTPVTIAPGETASISVRFAPSTEGSYLIRIILQTNTSAGTEEVMVEGERGEVAFTIAPTSLSFDPTLAAPNTHTVQLTNSGTVPLPWSLPASVGAYTIVSVVPAETPVGASSTLTLRYDGPASGAVSEMLTITEAICGTSHDIALSTLADVDIVRLRIPHDSAAINTPVSMPILFSSISGLPPDDDDTLTVSVTFIGTTFFYEGITVGEVSDTIWEMESRRMTLRLRIPFAERSGDTLTMLTGRALLSAELVSPMILSDPFWLPRNVTTELEPGSLTIVGDCLDDGVSIEVRPPAIAKIVPNPGHSFVTIAIDLPEGMSTRGLLIDARGSVIEFLPETFLFAGLNSVRIDADRLPSGDYTVVVVTHTGQALSTMRVVR